MSKKPKAAVKKRRRIGKDFLPILIAITVSSIGIFIGNFLKDRFIDAEVEDVFIINQPYWELGTVAYVEFTDPNINIGTNYIEIDFHTSRLKSFEISSFSSRKYSISNNRNSLINSLYPSRKNPLTITMVSKNLSVKLVSKKYYVSHFAKNQEMMTFRIHWMNSVDKVELLEMLSDSKNNIYTMLFDFQPDHSIIHKHVGLISVKGKISLRGSQGEIRASIKNPQHNQLINSLLYSLGTDKWVWSSDSDFIELAESNDDKRFEKKNIKDVFSAISIAHPRILLFARDLSLIGSLDEIYIMENELIIKFITKDATQDHIYGIMNFNVMIESDPDVLFGGVSSASPEPLSSKVKENTNIIPGDQKMINKKAVIGTMNQEVVNNEVQDGAVSDQLSDLSVKEVENEESIAPLDKKQMTGQKNTKSTSSLQSSSSSDNKLISDSHQSNHAQPTASGNSCDRKLAMELITADWIKVNKRFMNNRNDFYLYFERYEEEYDLYDFNYNGYLDTVDTLKMTSRQIDSFRKIFNDLSNKLIVNFIEVDEDEDDDDADIIILNVCLKDELGSFDLNTGSFEDSVIIIDTCSDKPVDQQLLFYVGIMLGLKPLDDTDIASQCPKSLMINNPKGMTDLDIKLINKLWGK